MMSIALLRPSFEKSVVPDREPCRGPGRGADQGRRVNTGRRARRDIVALVLFLASLVATAVLPGATAAAHGFSSTVYVTASQPATHTVRAKVELELDLLIVSVAENEDDPQLFYEGEGDLDDETRARVLDGHGRAIRSYVGERFHVSAAGSPCASEQVGGFAIGEREGVPYGVMTLDFACPPSDDPARVASAHEIRSTLFPDSEGYVKDTKTIIDYELDGRSGSAALDAAHPEFSTGRSWTDRFAEFFVLGAEHLLSGLDHILFLLALIVGSRRLRDIVLAATSFTLAHSVTFILAALGAVTVPDAVVEPIIAFSITAVAVWHLWGVWRTRQRTTELARAGWLGLTRADWMRLAVVYVFGLVHGLGFAGALGIDEPFSGTLLWSLLVFNLGIEVVQLSIIAVVFPLQAVLRKKAPVAGMWVGVLVATAVAAIGLVWFFQRTVAAG